MSRNRPGRPPLDPSGIPRPAVCVKLTSSSYDDAYALAQRKRVSVPQVLRHALERFLKDERSGPA